MQVSTVSTTGENALLGGIRAGLEGADRALLCVAFASDQGVHLLGDQLRRLGSRARILVTTDFGTSTGSALNALVGMGAKVAVLNPSGGTYHPRLYLADRGADESVAVVGSANLTGGLVTNHEVATVLRGTRHEDAIRSAWEWAECRWADDRVRPWEPDAPAPPPRFDPDVYAWLRTEVQRNPVFMTLGSHPKPNRIVDVTPHEIYVETERTMDRSTGPQPIPAWMFELALDALKAHGTLTNAHLLNILRVHRSSAVCAILARMPHVTVASSSPIVLRWTE